MSAMSVVLGTAAVFITSCGETTNNISISPSTNEVVNIKVGEEVTVSFKVEDYVNDGEVFLTSTDDSGYSSGESETAKIKFQAEYKGSGVTEVIVEGVSGGTATLIAKTKEGGNKTAQIKINVSEYSSSITLKDNHIFVSPNTDLVPSAAMFNFSNNSTERDMTFYFVNSGTVNESSIMSDQGYNADGAKLIGQDGTESLLECLEFTSCKLSDDKESLIFIQSETKENGEYKTFSKSVYDTQSFYFVAEYDNGTTTKLYSPVKFYAFKGLDNSAFEFTTLAGGQITGASLVTYSTEDRTYSQIMVKVPKSEDTQYCFDYKISNEDISKISVTLEDVKNESGKNYKVYFYTIRSKIAKRGSAKVKFNLYYNNFFGTDDESVSVTKDFNVEIYVKPKTIKVNELEETDLGNNYKFYNYNVGDYGWKNLKISVYAEDSSYTDCTLTFPENIDVRQGNSILSSGNSITDLTKPIQVRGKSGAAAGNGTIALTLNSPFDRDDSDKITYSIRYTIEPGATELNFTQEEYNYSSTNQSYGIYVSTTGGDAIFEGIYADHVFERATVTSLQNSGVARVQYVGQRVDGEKSYVQLKISPVAVGNDTFEIRLDNGRTINATIRVVETFDNLFINREGANTSVYSFTKTQNSEGDDESATIIIRNPYEENAFGEKAGIKISSNNGIDVIKEISFSSNGTISTIKETDDRGVYEITTNSNGKTIVNFSVIGYKVEDFCLRDLTKEVRLTIESYKLAEEFSVYSDRKLANSITLFTGDDVSTDLSTKTFSYEVKSSNAFNFFSYENQTYYETTFNDAYVYWTADKDIYDSRNRKVSTMVYGETYTIDRLVQFNTRTLTIAALPTASNTNFTLYATIRQYGLTKAFAVNVEIKSFTSVDQVNVSLSGTAFSFTKNSMEKSFVVNAAPLNATVLDIDFVIENKDGSKRALILTPEKGKIKDGTWLVTVRLDPGVLDKESDYSSECTLYICAKEWVSNGKIKDGARFKSYKVTYQSGTVENPYQLETPEDVLAIGNSDSAMKSHYKITSLIDMSAYAGRFPFTANGGVFEGSIVGEGDAKISGIKVTNGNLIEQRAYYGLFAILGDKAIIKDIVFEGSIEAQTGDTNETYIGLLAGQSLAELNNISVYLQQSRVTVKTTGDVYIGAIAGLNKANITKTTNIPVVMEGQLLVTAETMTSIYVGGVAGKSEGIIEDQSEKIQLSGLLGNLVYANISLISSIDPYSKKVFVGAVAGMSTNNIRGKADGTSKTIVSGRVHSNISSSYVGGIVGVLQSSNDGECILQNFKVRTFVSGYEVGAVLAHANKLQKVTYLDIEEIDDGESLNDEASMVVRYKESEYFKTYGSDEDVNEKNKKLSYIAFNSDSKKDSLSEEVEDETTGETIRKELITFKSYSTRDKTEIKITSETDKTFNFSGQLTDHYGSYLEFSPGLKLKYAQYWFEGNTTSVVEITKGDMSVELTAEEGKTAPKMFTAYYFKAEKYLDENGQYTSANLQNAQKILDAKFNTISVDSKLRPFKITSNDITIKSESSLVSVDNMNNLIIRGTGLAKLKIYNSLNARESQDIYLYIMNFYNHNVMESTSFNVMKSTSFFSYGDVRWGSVASANLVADNNLIINVSPSYRTKSTDLDMTGNFDITKDGEIYVDNMTIQLAPNEEIKTSIVPENSKIFAQRAAYDISSNLITISKTGAVIEKDASDKLTLSSSLLIEADGVEYSYKYTNSCELTLKYYEGAKSVKSLYDTYIINSGSTQSDTITIESDDSSETLNYTITGEDYIQENKEKLFSVTITPSTDSLVKKVEIKINKRSDEYQNRYTKNIFGTYKIRFYAGSNSDVAYKDITLILDDQSLDGVIFENYADQNERVASQKIVPSQYGMISVTLAPADVDFKTFIIENADGNYAYDSTSGSFEILYQKDANFESVPGAVYTSKGISISKEKLVAANSNFDGQFFIRYMFGYTRFLKDGSNIGLNIRLIGNNENEIYAESLTYKINTQYTIFVSIDDKTLEDQKYYIAKGLRYGLTVVNNGFEESSVEVTTSNPSLAQIEVENGKYYLKVISREIDYANEGTFQLIVSGSRTDVDGKVISASTSSSVKIMEYIFNTKDAKGNEFIPADIVKNYQDGIIPVAISGNNELSIDLEKYLEYDSSNGDVLNKIKAFMQNATSDGKWTVYFKNDENEVVDWDQKDTDNTKFTRIEIKNGRISNKYFDFRDLEYSVKIEHDPNVNKIYSFTYKAGYQRNENDGTYSIISYDEESNKNLLSEFTFATYIMGAEDTPNPITNYDNLKSMGVNAHYILMNDITITPEDYRAINGIFASLDGNGKKIIFSGGTYTLSDSELGVFSEVSQDSIIKNLKVVFGSDEQPVNIVSSSTDSVIFGGVASRNSGTITNANVSGNLTFVNSNTNVSSYVAGIVGSNAGTITNSQVTASIRTNGASLAGLVGQNTKLIASSYFKGGKLENITEQNTNFNTAGLVNMNSENGVIMTSYCSGVIVNTRIYSDSADGSELVSNVQVAGAVHTNRGVVRDSYSNIPISTKSSSSGFIYKNSGTVSNCYSTSILDSNKQTNYYFVAETSIEGQGTGTFKNCYYLKDENINQSLHPLVVKGVNQLKSDGFGDRANFESYAYGDNYNNVWMWVKNIQYPFSDVTLAEGRLELVTANIIASSIRVEDGKEEENGKTTYKYRYEEDVPQPGTMLNPYLVTSADTFLNYMSLGRDGYFRIIKDIDLNDVDITSYKTDFYGIIEGNGMSLTSADITSGKSASSAGLIGSIKTSTSPSANRPQHAGIMNLTLVPEIVNFPNVPIVGSLVGSVENATIENVAVKSSLTDNAGQDTSTVIVSGKNIVGGVVGLVKNKGYIKNITSTVGAKSTFIPSESARASITTGIYNGSNISSVSYAGDAVGYAFATSDQIKIQDVQVYSTSAYAIADRAGFAFGGLSKSVDVKTVTVNVNENMLIKAYSFGGLVVGENAGNLSDIVVTGSGSQSNVFSVQTYIPKGVGGIAGFMIKGTLSDVYMGQSFEIENVSLTNTVDYVGGIIGYSSSTETALTTLERIVMDGDISSRNYLGGIVGYTNTNVEMSNIAVYKHDLKVEGMLAEVYVGGFVGRNAGSVKITDAYSLAKIYVNAFSYSVNISVNVGAIIGSTSTKGDGENIVNYRTELQNIYTITTYEVSMENKSTTAAAKQITDVNEGVALSESQKYQGVKVNINNKDNSLFTNIDSLEKKKETNVLNFIPTTEKYVLNSGNGDPTTLLMVRADPAESGVTLTFNQNELGWSVCKWYNFDKGTQSGVQQTTPSEGLYYTFAKNISSSVTLKENINNSQKYSFVDGKFVGQTHKVEGKDEPVTGTLAQGKYSKNDVYYDEVDKCYYIKSVESDNTTCYYKVEEANVTVSLDPWTTPYDNDNNINGLSTLVFEKTLRMA